ncbi:unnamed protein product [Spirodela intermedia]|uniref:NAD-dependent epimerase/dehydratase domain-containing protein n=1 Tax=Spirodela intermedia TaxID=51605 RepID=A0A7I8K8S2_SPIIN|nr:unnamed protein product [Spirodela intermedia]
MAKERRVCVTGAGGFIASWLMKQLLSKGFTIHRTERDPKWKISENLELFKANMLDYESLAVSHWKIRRSFPCNLSHHFAIIFLWNSYVRYVVDFEGCHNNLHNHLSCLQIIM